MPWCGSIEPGSEPFMVLSVTALAALTDTEAHDRGQRRGFEDLSDLHSCPISCFSFL